MKDILSINQTAEPRPSLLTWMLRGLVLVIAYFLSAKLGLTFSTVATNVTLLWPPTGLALAALLSQGLGILLFGVKPWDPAIFAAVILTLTVAGLVACIIPARRATRIDPVQALRYD